MLLFYYDVLTVTMLNSMGPINFKKKHSLKQFKLKQHKKIVTHVEGLVWTSNCYPLFMKI